MVATIILLSFFTACSKKEEDSEEVITFMPTENESPVEASTVQNTETPVPIPVADTDAPADVKDLIASSGDGSVMLSWTNPADEDFTKVVITYGVDGTAVVRGVPGGMGKQYIADLKNGVEYTFTVMTVDKTGNASDGTQVSSTPTGQSSVSQTETSAARTEPANKTEAAPATTTSTQTAQVSSSTPASAPVTSQVSSPVSASTPATAQVSSSAPASTPVTAQVSSSAQASTPVTSQVSSPVSASAPATAQVSSSAPASTPVTAQVSSSTPASAPVTSQATSPATSTQATSATRTSSATVAANTAQTTSAPISVIPATTYHQSSETTLSSEPEPVIDASSSSTVNTFIPYIRSADGNIAANLETVFQKTGETVVLAKATAIELNGQKSLVSAFRMCKYPVTQELFEAVMGTNPSKCVASSNLYKTAEGEVTKLKPCDKISWYDAIVFCNKLSILMEYEPCYIVNGIDDWLAIKYEDIPVEYNSDWSDISCDFTRNGFRLPTENEWEIAARGGNPEAAEWNYAFSGKDSSIREATNEDLDSVGWYRYNICNNGVTSPIEPTYGVGYGTHEVGLKAPNSLSLYDLCGNVWEWCWDMCKTTDENSTSSVDPVPGVPDDSCRALRGGSWGIEASCCDIPSRLIEYEFYRSARYGFRLVRTGAAD